MTEFLQKDDEFQPAASLTITSLETLKMVSDPLRIRILETLLAEARTVKQAAALLGMPPTKLYYHFNVLEEHGLIRSVSSRIVSGIIEKAYRIAAYRIVVDRSLLTVGETPEEDNVGPLVSAVLDSTKDQILERLAAKQLDLSLTDDPRKRLYMANSENRIPYSAAQEFYTRLHALVQEFDAIEVDPQTPDSDFYSLVIAMYPFMGGPQLNLDKGDSQ